MQVICCRTTVLQTGSPSYYIRVPPAFRRAPLAGIYFNKIQCFCFEEQRLRAGEEIDMPVFFFLDPEMLDDPTMDSVNNVTLSYTFFQTAEEDAVVEQEDDEEEEEEERQGEGGGVVAATR